jgi:hypothetical protein
MRSDHASCTPLHDSRIVAFGSRTDVHLVEITAVKTSGARSFFA